MELNFYTPTPVRLPQDSPIKRKLSRRNAKRPSHVQQDRFDFDTVFYDVLFDPDKNTIVAVGPKWLNLKDYLLPLEVFVNNRRVDYQFGKLGAKLCMLHTDPLDEITAKGIDVEFRFHEFSFQCTIEPAKVRSRNQLGARLTVCTLQKNNHIEWIEDWINWHYRLHGIKRLIFYDNGSDNSQKIVDRLALLNVDMEVWFIDWPFKYGLNPDKFAQRGAFNHCRLLFPVPNGYCMNIDIDEYVVYTEDNSLLDYLDQVFGSFPVGSIRLRENWIPCQKSIRSQNSAPMRAYDHGFHRYDQGIQPNGKTKCIYRYDKIIYNSVHLSVSARQGQSERKYTWRNQLDYAILNDRKFVEKCIGLPPSAKVFRSTYFAPPSHLFYFHFRGLRSDPTSADDPVIDKFDPKVHVKEPRIQQYSQLAGILPDEDGLEFFEVDPDSDPQK